MKEEQTISWIFLATVLASKTRPSDFQGVLLVADGINHAVPTHKELQLSFSWLTNQGLIIKFGNKYELTKSGELEYEKASKGISTLLAIWESLELRIKDMEANKTPGQRLAAARYQKKSAGKE